MIDVGPQRRRRPGRGIGLRHQPRQLADDVGQAPELRDVRAPGIEHPAPDVGLARVIEDERRPRAGAHELDARRQLPVLDAQIERPAALPDPPHAGKKRGTQAVVGLGMPLNEVTDAAHARVLAERRQRRVGLRAAIDGHLGDDGGDARLAQGELLHPADFVSRPRRIRVRLHEHDVARHARARLGREPVRRVRPRDGRHLREPRIGDARAVPEMDVRIDEAETVVAHVRKGLAPRSAD